MGLDQLSLNDKRGKDQSPVTGRRFEFYNVFTRAGI